MYKWINTLVEGWKHVKYINVGEVTNNSYLGWKKLRGNKQYVTVNPTTGNIDWYYSFENGSWHRKDSFEPTATEYSMLPEEITLTLAVNNENYGEVSASVEAPNVYDKTTGKIIKMEGEAVSVTMTATAEEGYEADYWYKDTASTTKLNEGNSTYTVSMNDDTKYTVVFKQSV